MYYCQDTWREYEYIYWRVYYSLLHKLNHEADSLQDNLINELNTCCFSFLTYSSPYYTTYRRCNKAAFTREIIWYQPDSSLLSLNLLYFNSHTYVVL